MEYACQTRASSCMSLRRVLLRAGPDSVHRLRLAVDAVTASLRDVAASRVPEDAGVVVPTRVLRMGDAGAADAGSPRELVGRAIVARGCCWVLVPAPLFGAVVVAELRLAADVR